MIATSVFMEIPHNTFGVWQKGDAVCASLKCVGWKAVTNGTLFLLNHSFLNINFSRETLNVIVIQT